MTTATATAPPTTELLPLHGRGFVAIPADEIDRLITVARTPGAVAVWAVLRMEASHRGGHRADLPRQWVVERTNAAAPTADVMKKIPGRVRALTDAALCIALVGDPRRVRVEFPRVRHTGPSKPGEWTSRLRAHDLDRIIDPADPMSWADLVPWLRWQQVLRLDEVWVTQAELARRWQTNPRTVRREQARLCELGLLEVDRQPGGLCRYWAGELSQRARTRVLGATTARWIRHDDHDIRASDTTGPDGMDAPPAAAAQEAKAGRPEALSAAPVGPDKVGTRSGQSRHQSSLGTPTSTRTRVPAVASHPVGTPVPTPQSPGRCDPCDPAAPPQSCQTQPRDHEGSAASPRRQAQSSRPVRDLAWRQARRLVQGQQWLMAAPDSVHWQLVATLAGHLRRQLPGVAPASLAVAISQIDPDDHTTSHVALVRQAISGLVADTKAAPQTAPPTPDPTPQRPSPATPVVNDGANEAPARPDTTPEPALTIDPAWAEEPTPAEPRWHRTDPDDPDAMRWLAVLFLRRPALRPVTVQQRLPETWHPTVEQTYHQVQRTRIGQTGTNRPRFERTGR